MLVNVLSFPTAEFAFMRPYMNMTSEQGTHFRAKEIPEWNHEQGSYHIPHHSKAAGMTEQWNSVKFIVEVVV